MQKHPGQTGTAYMVVTVTNNAGLRSSFNSEPVLVDGQLYIHPQATYEENLKCYDLWAATAGERK